MLHFSATLQANLRVFSLPILTIKRRRTYNKFGIGLFGTFLKDKCKENSAWYRTAFFTHWRRNSNSWWLKPLISGTERTLNHQVSLIFFSRGGQLKGNHSKIGGEVLALWNCGTCEQLYLIVLRCAGDNFHFLFYTCQGRWHFEINGPPCTSEETEEAKKNLTKFCSVIHDRSDQSPFDLLRFTTSISYSHSYAVKIRMIGFFSSSAVKNTLIIFTVTVDFQTNARHMFQSWSPLQQLSKNLKCATKVNCQPDW